MSSYNPKKETLLKILYAQFFLTGIVLTLESQTSDFSFYTFGRCSWRNSFTPVGEFGSSGGIGVHYAFDWAPLA